MELKKSLRYLFLALPAIILSACDDVDTADRLIETAPVKVARTVLLEDFTGQKCSNCPDAHDRIHSLVEQYGDNLIPVSIHAGGLATSVNSTNFDYNYVGLMTDDGQAYDARYNKLNSWPAGTVNRGEALSHSGWAAAVYDAISQQPDLSIEVEAKSDNGKISIESTLRPTADLKGSYQLWITEDGIVARQKLPDNSEDKEYVHNHVFRAAVNGTWGEEMAISSGIHTTLSHSIDVRYTDKERWDVNNLSVVAFFYNDKGVLQAARAKVTTTTQPEE